MQFWIGTSGFQYPEWKGGFYPEKLSVRLMLPFYAERFSTTEINYSFRQIPSEKSLSNWASTTPPKFKFSFKAPQKITHFARLRDCATTLAFFGEAISKLNQKLGAVLFQLPPGFAKDSSRLRAFLETIPPCIKAAFEFRHPSWFDDEIFSVLRESKAALCIAEAENLTTPSVATADFGYLRLRREDYSEAQLNEWAEFVKEQERQWHDVFIYFKHEERGIGPKFAAQMMKSLADLA